MFFTPISVHQLRSRKASTYSRLEIPFMTHNDDFSLNARNQIRHPLQSHGMISINYPPENLATDNIELKQQSSLSSTHSKFRTSGLMRHLEVHTTVEHEVVSDIDVETHRTKSVPITESSE